MSESKKNRTTTDLVHYRILKTQSIILSNDKYIKAGRCKELTEKICHEFDVKTRAAQRYISEAREQINEQMEKNRDEALKKALNDREYVIAAAKTIFENSQDTKDLKVVLEGMKERDQLADLYPEKKVKNENVNVDLSKFTDKGLKLLAKGTKVHEVMLDPECIIHKFDE